MVHHSLDKNLLEFLNLFIILSDFVFLAGMGYYLSNNWYSKGRNLAIGLSTYVLGHTIVRVWNWYWGFYINISDIPTNIVLYTASLVTISVGLFLILKTVFETVSEWLWLTIILLPIIAYFIAFWIT